MKQEWNWKARIKKAKSIGRFSIKDEFDAHNWPSCAIGEKFKLSQKLHDVHLVGDIYDEKTIQLGLAFTRAVNENNFNLAEILWNKIQKLTNDSVLIKGKRFI